MKNNRLLFLILLAVVVVASLNYIAGIFYYYWTINWFDSLVHFLAGIAMGLFSIWIYFQSGIFKRSIPEKREAVIASIIFVIVVGVGWEFFEYTNGLTQSTESYSLDTMHDLISDILGALVAGGLAMHKKLYV
jgi:hypothetical protein